MVRAKIRYFEERWQQMQKNLEENQEEGSSQILQNVDHFESHPDGIDEDVDMKNDSDSLEFYQDIEIKGDNESCLNENAEKIEVKNDKVIENSTPISNEIEIRKDPGSALGNASNEIHECLDTNEFHQKPSVMKDRESDLIEVEQDENDTPVSVEIEIKESPENASTEIHDNLDTNKDHQKPLDKSISDETPTDDTHDPSKPISILNGSNNSENFKRNSNDTEENNCNKSEKYRLFKTKNQKRNILQSLHNKECKYLKKELNCQNCVVKQFKSESNMALHMIEFHEKKVNICDKKIDSQSKVSDCESTQSTNTEIVEMIKINDCTNTNKSVAASNSPDKDVSCQSTKETFCDFCFESLNQTTPKQHLKLCASYSSNSN